MASVVDELFHREGQLDPDFAGLNQCAAGGFTWERERGESEGDFVARARCAARRLGYRLVRVSGHMTTVT